MRPEAELTRLLSDRNIEFIALPTDQAVREFNQRAAKEKVGGCFHLTC